MAGLLGLLTILASVPGRLEGRELQVWSGVGQKSMGHASGLQSVGCVCGKFCAGHNAHHLSTRHASSFQLELPATAAGLERSAAGVWVPPAESIRQLLDLVKQGALCCGLHAALLHGGGVSQN